MPNGLTSGPGATSPLDGLSAVSCHIQRICPLSALSHRAACVPALCGRAAPVGVATELTTSDTIIGGGFPGWPQWGSDCGRALTQPLPITGWKSRPDNSVSHADAGPQPHRHTHACHQRRLRVPGGLLIRVRPDPGTTRFPEKVAFLLIVIPHSPSVAQS